MHFPYPCHALLALGICMLHLATACLFILTQASALESGMALASLCSLPLGLDNMAIGILPHASSGAIVYTTYGEWTTFMLIIYFKSCGGLQNRTSVPFSTPLDLTDVLMPMVHTTRKLYSHLYDILSKSFIYDDHLLWVFWRLHSGVDEKCCYVPMVYTYHWLM